MLLEITLWDGDQRVGRNEGRTGEIQQSRKASTVDQVLVWSSCLSSRRVSCCGCRRASEPEGCKLRANRPEPCPMTCSWGLVSGCGGERDSEACWRPVVTERRMWREP